MIGIVLLLAVFVCISSIFFPALRKLAMSLLTTAAVIIGGCWVLVEAFHK